MQLKIPARRFFLIVLDGCGAGALPDAGDYGASDIAANTLGHTAAAVGGLTLPNLAARGWGNVVSMRGVPPCPNAKSLWGRLAEKSCGKDTVTGHWEMMGVILTTPFPTYPHGFPPEVVALFAEIAGVLPLGNFPASGTEILTKLGAQHRDTRRPILYTSADSVLQVAAHEDPAIFGRKRLYAVCEMLRARLAPPHRVGRVIARPFLGTTPETFRRTENRRDYPLPPPHPTVLDALADQSVPVHLIGKTGELFPRRDSFTIEPTTNNTDHMAALARAVRGDGPGGDAHFVFANLEDFDMLYGHRNDPVNFARLLNEFDDWLGRDFLPQLQPGDLVGITADHGNDPTTPGTDHSREYAPLLLFGGAITQPMPVGDRETFADWGATVADWLNVLLPAECAGRSLLS